MARIRNALLSVAVFVLLAFSPTFAFEITILAPSSFVRGTGKPLAESVTSRLLSEKLPSLNFKMVVGALRPRPASALQSSDSAETPYFLNQPASERDRELNSMPVFLEYQISEILVVFFTSVRIQKK